MPLFFFGKPPTPEDRLAQAVAEDLAHALADLRQQLAAQEYAGAMVTMLRSRVKRLQKEQSGGLLQ